MIKDALKKKRDAIKHIRADSCEETSEQITCCVDGSNVVEKKDFSDGSNV